MSSSDQFEEEGTTLEYTSTWVVAAVCTVIVSISLAMERLLHFTGEYLKRKNQKSLFDALQKVKEELMLLGFMSLILTVFQNAVSKICVPTRLADHLLPCKFVGGGGGEEEIKNKNGAKSATSASIENFFGFTVSGTARRLLTLSDESSSLSHFRYCGKEDKVPLLSLEAMHHLHIFIFVLAIVHVTFCVLTVVFGGARIQQWKHWEDSIAKESYDTEQALSPDSAPKFTHLHQHDFIKDHFLGIGKNTVFLGWLHSFYKQFYASVTQSDYETLRLGFIMTHCKGHPRFNFHQYLIRALEDDFKKVVGISWYLWIFVVFFLLLNVNGWHTYFWIAFIPFVLLLAVGTKLEHVIIQLAHEVAEKHIAVEGELVIQPSDDHFWFGRPKIVLLLIHVILFQNSFEIAFFFWIWVQFGFDSCIMGQSRFIFPRLIIGVFVQLLCSYSTLPLYAIVTQMGSSFKKVIFEEHVQEGLLFWAQKVKRRKGLKAASNQGSPHGDSSVRIQLGAVVSEAESTPETIQPATDLVLEVPNK